MTQQIRYYKQDGTEYDFSKTLKIRITQTSNADMNIGIQKQKTAVEQLMIDLFGEDFRIKINDSCLNDFQKALEKEKEQMLSEWKKGFEDAKYIYNQTYNL